MYLTKALFITQNSHNKDFIIRSENNLVLALDDQSLPSDSKIILEPGSSLKLIIINSKPNQKDLYQIIQGQNSNLKIFTIAIGKNYNLNLHHQSVESHTNFEFFGISLNLPQSSSNINLKSDLTKPFSNSLIVFNNTLYGDSKCNFTGTIKISKTASNSRVFLENKNLLVDKKSKITATPILEIYNPKVEAKHAATTGFLDEQALFYLQTRGLSYPQAHAIIVRAFNQGIVDRVSPVCFRDRFIELLNQNL
jgi:Fe-S cluster assembly protein SufD